MLLVVLNSQRWVRKITTVHNGSSKIVAHARVLSTDPNDWQIRSRLILYHVFQEGIVNGEKSAAPLAR